MINPELPWNPSGTVARTLATVRMLVTNRKIHYSRPSAAFVRVAGRHGRVLRRWAINLADVGTSTIDGLLAAHTGNRVALRAMTLT
jgi:hypothetical protein